MSDLIKREDAIGACAYETIECYEARKAIRALPSADRPQGYWIKTDVATYRCSECGKIQIADDVNELNFCCCCGSRNKVWRLKGADDYERAIEQMEHDMLYEPTYNSEDGSM